MFGVIYSGKKMQLRKIDVYDFDASTMLVKCPSYLGWEDEVRIRTDQILTFSMEWWDILRMKMNNQIPYVIVNDQIRI